MAASFKIYASTYSNYYTIKRTSIESLQQRTHLQTLQ